MDERERIIIPDENGEEHLFDILFTFDVDETEKSYLVAVPADQAEEEEQEVFAFRYEESETNDDDITLYQIDTEQEWEMIEEMLATFTEDDEE
ncbi:DUF1292 domain-containing protein [Filobacillus milosensis]|uniref:UPF0473 protein E3U55_00420 n=1 Tax=Filobacillus milosensis TaxID=94137 RepID=A0A4Y8ISL6_9BACI|nr:DUF1292 domain-containing protein [Filobacillus milosensis]TFB24890.1 DUF1292 domain-containing protein [Filobacillus milosensis]